MAAGTGVVAWSAEVRARIEVPLSAEDAELRLVDFCERLHLHVLKSSLFVFAPGAITAMAILSTSHAILHTWPEYHLIIIDLFSCSPKAAQEEIVEAVQTAFGATSP